MGFLSTRLCVRFRSRHFCRHPSTYVNWARWRLTGDLPPIAAHPSRVPSPRVSLCIARLVRGLRFDRHRTIALNRTSRSMNRQTLARYSPLLRTTRGRPLRTSRSLFTAKGMRAGNCEVSAAEFTFCLKMNCLVLRTQPPCRVTSRLSTRSLAWAPLPARNSAENEGVHRIRNLGPPQQTRVTATNFQLSHWHKSYVHERFDSACSRPKL